MAAFGFLRPAFLIVGLYLRTQHGVVAKRLNAEGRVVEGMVLTKSVRSSSSSSGQRNSSPTYEVTFRFLTPEGLVTYLPDAPETNRVDGNHEWIAGMVFMGIGGIFTLISGGLAYTDLRCFIRAIRGRNMASSTKGWLSAQSRPALRLIGCLNGPFPTAIGTIWVEHEGTSHLNSPEDGGPWKAGDIGTVRFDEKRPSISVWMGQPSFNRSKPGFSF